MKILLSFILSFMMVYAYAQDSVASIGEIITVNPVKEETRQSLLNAIFKYPGFVDAKLVYKDGTVIESKLNYHRYFQKLHFINENNDTLVLANPELFSMFILDKDTFYFHEKSYPYLITHYNEINLTKKEFISIIGIEKKGLYGTYSAVSSANSEKAFAHDDVQVTTWLKADENILYKIEDNFLLKDRFNNFFTASKKNFYNLFSDKQKELKKYLKANKVNFTREKDLLALMSYLGSL